MLEWWDFDSYLLEDAARRTAAYRVGSDLGEGTSPDPVVEKVLGYGDGSPGGRVGVEAGELERRGVGATLAPVDTDASIFAEHRRVMVVRPIGKTPIKCGEKCEDLVFRHRFRRRDEANFVSEGRSDQRDVVRRQAAHVCVERPGGSAHSSASSSSVVQGSIRPALGLRISATG